MSSIREKNTGRFELKVTNKLLPKEFYSTFSSYDEAKQYGDRLEALLKQGIVPAGLLEKKMSPRLGCSRAALLNSLRLAR